MMTRKMMTMMTMTMYNRMMNNTKTSKDTNPGGKKAEKIQDPWQLFWQKFAEMLRNIYKKDSGSQFKPR